MFDKGVLPQRFDPSGGTPWIATYFGKAKKGGEVTAETVLVRSAPDTHRGRAAVQLLAKS